MPPDFHISQSGARSLHLHAQQLLTPPVKSPDKAAVLHCIRQMSALQIDTINVVARSPYLVLWSRLGSYQQNWLNELLAEGKLFEYWSHEACFLPIEDFPHYRHRMLSPDELGWKFNARWLQEHASDVTKVYEHIRQHGAVRSIDFERQNNSASGWWDWKPEKRSLEVLFTTGQLMVSSRHHFQRTYDLRERVLPHWDDNMHLPDKAESEQSMVLSAVKALGIARPEWIADYFRMKKISPQNLPQKLAQQEKLLCVSIDKWNQTAYAHPDHLAALEKAADNKLTASATRLLSPFDPVVWDRRRAADLFDFNYKLECYTPAPKREFGYFCLPILRRGSLIGRLDAKAHRKQGVMEIKALFLEDHIRISDRLLTDLGKVIRDFASWHQCPEINIINSGPINKKQLIATL